MEIRKTKPSKAVKPKVVRIKKPVKRVNLSSLDKELDKYYSRFIRLRDSNGMFAACVTCGREHHITEMDNGHYISRARKATKYDERNTNIQCKRCNMFLKGNIAAYAVYLAEKYGHDVLRELLDKSNTIVKLTAEWYKQKISHYKKEVERMDIYNLWSKA